MSVTELDIKTGRLVSILEREGLGGVLINGQHNFAWLTSGGSNGIDLSRENGAASLLVTRTGKRYLIANNIEMPRMLAEEVSDKDFEPVEIAWQVEKAIGDTALKEARKLVEGEVATDIALFAAAPAVDGKIAPCRYSLTNDELGRYKDLGCDAGIGMRRVIGTLEHGESEIAVAQKIRAELATQNITSVVTLVAADERIGQFRHPIPTGKAWNKTLLMVTCAKRFGLIVSLSRIVCLGAVPEDLQRKTEAVASVNAAFLNATRIGATGSELYGIAAKAYEHAGYADEINLHHQGGAAGYKTRDWVAHPQNNEIVQANQAFAWNPSITGTKAEETVIATENGVEVITTSPDFPYIVTNLNGNEYRSPGILSI